MRLLELARVVLVAAVLVWAAGCGGGKEARTYPAKHAAARGNAARACPYVASVKAEPYHRPGCAHAKRVPLEDLVGYKTKAGAEKDEHRPCSMCKP